jgi:hypothetical protein
MIKLYHPGTQVVADEHDTGTLVDAEFGGPGHPEGEYPNHGCNEANCYKVECLLDAVFFHVRIDL